MKKLILATTLLTSLLLTAFRIAPGTLTPDKHSDSKLTISEMITAMTDPIACNPQ